jgi:hypothetical protein
MVQGAGVEGVVCGLEGIHLADRCMLTKLEYDDQSCLLGYTAV